MVKGLVLFDYDGTLVDEQEGIFQPTALTRKSISRLQELGYLCVLATGRALSYIPETIQDLHLDGYVTCNGASVIIHNQEVFMDVFDDVQLKALIDDFDRRGINFFLENNALCYVKDLKEATFLSFMEKYKVPWKNFVAYENLGQVRGKISKITAAYPNDEMRENDRAYLKSHYQYTFHKNCSTSDIGKLTIHKGVGVKEAAQYFHIPMEHTYAFGDGYNDVELLASVRYGIAMGKHHPMLDQVAYMVTKTVKEEGIYDALRKLEVI